MNIILLKVLRFYRKTTARFFINSRINKIKNSSNIRIRQIAFSVEKIINDTLTEKEKEFFDKIEHQRNKLLKCDKSIQVVDYGAGSPKAKLTQEQMNNGVVYSSKVSNVTLGSKPKFWAKLLFSIIRELKPNLCLELGTCVGISASYQAKALELNGNGHLVTLEGAQEIAEIANETFKILNLSNIEVVVGAFHSTLQNVLEKNKPIDYFFNDGHHSHDAVLNYFEQAIPYLSSEAIVVFDDIMWSSGMQKAWKKIKKHSSVEYSIDMGDIGIVILSSNKNSKQHFKLFL